MILIMSPESVFRIILLLGFVNQIGMICMLSKPYTPALKESQGKKNIGKLSIYKDNKTSLAPFSLCISKALFFIILASYT